MSNMMEIGNLLRTTESEEADSGTTTVEITMVEALGDTMHLTQGGNEPGLERCDCEGTEEETLDVRPPADQTDAPQLPLPLLPLPLLPLRLLSQPLLSQPQRTTIPEEKTHHPQVQATVVLQPQWAVGEPCQAMWSEDGNIYAATILKLEGERCRVRFDSYGNEDEVDVSSLKPREPMITQAETQAKGSQAETQAKGSQAETQARGSQAETQAKGSQAETQARGSQAETQARGSQAETHAKGSQAETQAKGSQAETQARGSQAETQAKGSQAETQARGSQAETQARGSQAETQARGSQAETQARGSQAETQARGSQAETQARGSQEWTAGSRCRATYALDGISYPAVVLEVRGQRCRVRFDDYNNEEEVEMSSLLSLHELNGPSRSGRLAAPWKPALGTAARRRREAPENGDKREPERMERDRVDRSERGRDRNWKDPQLGTKLPRDRSSAPSREDERKSAESAAYPVFSCPPFPPPPLHSSGDWWTSMAPPPLPSGSSDSGPAPDSLPHVLMMWYMCGFHTGSYLTLQQLKSPHRD